MLWIDRHPWHSMGCDPATLHIPSPVYAGVAAEGSLPEREFSYYPRLTAMSTMYPDEADAAQVSTSQPPCSSRLSNYQTRRAD